MVVVAFLPACMTFEVEGRGSFTPESTTGSSTVHGSLYGFNWGTHSVEKCEAENLFRVEYHTNAAFLLASVVTLGLYVPQTVEWWCDAAAGDDAEEEVWDPSSS